MESLLQQPEWAIFVLLLLALVAAVEGGWRLGHRDRNDSDDGARSQVGAIQGAVLGLLALLLGFTFSMAAQRFDARKALVLDESNAIGTAYLRAELVGAPERQILRDLLRRYVDTRVEFYRAGIDEAKQSAVDAESERLHAELWRNATVVAEREPKPTTALLVAALNDVIDLHSTRVAALGNHVPSVILWLLLIVAALASGLTGYAAGFGSRRHWIPTAIVLLLISVVIIVIIDLDRPRRGLIQSGQKSMLDLQRSLKQVATSLH